MGKHFRIYGLVGAVLALGAVNAGAQLLNRPGGGARQQNQAELSVRTYTDMDGVRSGGTIRVAVDAEITEGWHVHSNTPYDPTLIPTVLSFEENEPFDVSAFAYPEGFDARFSFSDEVLSVYEEHFTIGAVVEVAPETAPGEYTLNGSLRWQACNDETCLFPQDTPVEIAIRVVSDKEQPSPTHREIFDRIDFDDATAAPADKGDSPPPTAVAGAEDTGWRELADDFEVVGLQYGYMSTDAFLNFVDRAETGQGLGGMFEGMSLVTVIALTLIGGLALNLTPCVLPIIPINLAIIGAGAQAGSRSRGFALGGVYGVGIALVYGVLGLVVVLTTASFGALNQTSWFNFGIAALFVVLALAMFDVIPIDFSKLQAKFGGFQKGRGTFYLAFGMGSVSALLAGACVAPVVIAVILFAQDLYAGNYKLAGITLPFFLGLGMALPWPFAGAGLSFLPKPGKWMNYVKYAFGVFILGFAVYYGHMGYTLLPADKEAVLSSVNELDDDLWRHSLTEGLAEAKAEDKRVMIDFWATWCKNCLAMNESTFKDPAFKERMEDYVLVKFQAERYSDPNTKAAMEYFDVLGLPTYVVLEPKSM